MHPLTLPCPSCAGAMKPRALECAACGLRVEGAFAANEFARIDGDDLHLLRIFVFCEGSVRAMEAALGVSYPTVKARIAALKGRLALDTDPLRPDVSAPDRSPSSTLDALERGDIDAATAIARLRQRQVDR